MQGRFYPEVFSRAGLDLIVPDEAEQDYIHEKYMGELLNNIFLPETRAGLLEIVASAERHAGQALAGEVEVFAEIRAWKNNF